MFSKYQVLFWSIFVAILFDLNAEIPASSLKKMAPMGEIYHPVSTTNEEAQKSFDMGLTYKYAFNHDMSFVEFEKASKFDPNLAMAYWGMALALGQNINEDIKPENEIRCYNYIQHALKLSSTASANEQAYISALAVRYTNETNADLVPLRFRYRDAMKKVIETYPEDLDAVTLYAESILGLYPWKWWTREGKPVDGTMEAIEKLDYVINRNSSHLGANHFYIHAWEESPTPERALLSAYRLPMLFPEGGHIVHMPCHILIPVGDYETAVQDSKQSISLDQAYFKHYGLSLGKYPLHYLPHNIYVLVRAYMLMEDYDNAIKTAFEVTGFVKPYVEKMSNMAHYESIPLEVYLYFHKWKEILEYQLTINDPAENAFWHYSRAKAFATLNDLESAEKEKEQMQYYKKQIPQKETLAYNHAINVIEVAEYDLEAAFSKAQKMYPENIFLLQKSVELQDKLNYDEPPPWYISQRIALGAALIDQKLYVEAEKAFLDVLKKLKRNGRALFGLFLSLRGQNRVVDAFWIEREAHAALQNASGELKLEDL